MNGFWKQTLSHFKLRVHLENIEHNAFCNSTLAVITFFSAVVVVCVTYIPLAFYKAFAPHRIMRRLKTIKESQ